MRAKNNDENKFDDIELEKLEEKKRELEVMVARKRKKERLLSDIERLKSQVPFYERWFK